MNASLSVLICTYNRHELLKKALQSLNNANEKPDKVVIVNGGDNLADQVVESFSISSSIKFELIKTENKNLATSRNIGLPHCNCEIIAMTDDDAQVFPDWVSKMKEAHREHPEAGAVGGKVIGMNTHSLVGKVADAITFPSWSQPGYVRTLPGVNISYKRKVIEQVGKQDETLFRGEDVDYNWRVQKLGYKIYYDPAIQVYHFHRPDLKGFLNQHYMYGRAYYLVRRKWQDMYSIYPHHLRTARELLKLLNFFASAFYQPFIDLKKLSSWKDRLFALPLLFLAGAAWRSGMIVEKRRTMKQPGE